MAYLTTKLRGSCTFYSCKLKRMREIITYNQVFHNQVSNKASIVAGKKSGAEMVSRNRQMDLETCSQLVSEWSIRGIAEEWLKVELICSAEDRLDR